MAGKHTKVARDFGIERPVVPSGLHALESNNERDHGAYHLDEGSGLDGGSFIIDRNSLT
jgi:hypothetical protein